MAACLFGELSSGVCAPPDTSQVSRPADLKLCGVKDDEDIDMDASEILTLERDIRSAREVAVRVSSATPTTSELPEWLTTFQEKSADYVKLLLSCKEREDVFRVQLCLPWKSYITARKGVTKYKAKAIEGELGLWLARFALVLRTSSAGACSDASVLASKEAMQQWVAVMRKAAGILNFLHSNLKPQEGGGPVAHGWSGLTGSLGHGSDASEVNYHMIACLSRMVLAEAQLLCCSRSEASGHSSKLIAQLYVGGIAAVKSAKRAITNNIGAFEEVPDSLMKYLTLLERLSTSRALRFEAQTLYERANSGEATSASGEEQPMSLAIHYLKGAAEHCERCLVLCEDKAQERFVKAELGEVLVPLVQKWRKENGLVHMQKEMPMRQVAAGQDYNAANRMRLPEGRVIASAVPFDLTGK